MRALHLPTNSIVLALCVIGALILMRCPTSYRLRRVDRLLATGRTWEARRVMDRIKAELGLRRTDLLVGIHRGRK